MINDAKTATKRRAHIALICSGSDGVNVYKDGQYIGTSVDIRNILEVTILSYIAPISTKVVNQREVYVDHFQICDTVHWGGVFDPPSMDSYI